MSNDDAYERAYERYSTFTRETLLELVALFASTIARHELVAELREQRHASEVDYWRRRAVGPARRVAAA